MKKKPVKEESIAREGFITQQQIADVLGVSRAMVHEIEKRAMRKIRQQFKMRGWKFEDFFD